MRKRFYKPHHFLNKAGNNPLQSLSEIFQNFHLDDFREEISLWEQFALSNDKSAYVENGEREDLIDFTHELHKLMEAFHILNEKRNQQGTGEQIKGSSKNTKELPLQMNVSVLLTVEEKANPDLVIKHFCETFELAYAEMEILDMLDAVITYEGDNEVYTGNLVLFYQHVHYLIRLAYMMDKSKEFLKK